MDAEENKVLVNLYSGWFEKRIDAKYKTNNYNRIMDFYVLNTICPSITYKGKSVKEMGWPKNVWKTNLLRNSLFNIIIDDKHIKDRIIIPKVLSEMQNAINRLGLDKHFHKIREEKILAFQKSNLTQIESIFYHIRNSFAHGRFQIYSYDNEIFYAIESGIPKRNIEKCALRARMILKEKTLIKWIDIITNPNQEKNAN